MEKRRLDAHVKRYHPEKYEPDPKEESKDKPGQEPKEESKDEPGQEPKQARPNVPLFTQPNQVDSSVQPVDSPQPVQALKVQPLPMKPVTSVFEGTEDMVRIVTSGVENGA